jgi:hypothetical protein
MKKRSERTFASNVKIFHPSVAWLLIEDFWEFLMKFKSRRVIQLYASQRDERKICRCK